MERLQSKAKQSKANEAKQLQRARKSATYGAISSAVGVQGTQ
jgi:hypothetical protein